MVALSDLATARAPQDDARRRCVRDLFPGLADTVWLNTASSAPACLPVVAALSDALADWAGCSYQWRDWEQDANVTRDLLARMIGAHARNVALQSSLSHAAATVAASLPVGKIVVAAQEFRSNLLPWTALEKRGFSLSLVDSEQGHLTTEVLLASIDSATSLVAVSEVQSMSGCRIDIQALRERCEKTGTRIFLNLTQSLGALRFSVREIPVDYAAVHGYKWLLCPRGAAWLYVCDDHLSTIEPLAPNWKSAPHPYEDYYGPVGEFAPGARKLDTSLAWLPWVGARAALELLTSLQSEETETHCLSLGARFRQGASNVGIPAVGSDMPSHIVALRVKNPLALQRRLEEENVRCSVRGDVLRFGFHVFNDVGDVDTALRHLHRWQ